MQSFAKKDNWLLVTVHGLLVSSVGSSFTTNHRKYR